MALKARRLGLRRQSRRLIVALLHRARIEQSPRPASSAARPFPQPQMRIRPNRRVVHLQYLAFAGQTYPRAFAAVPLTPARTPRGAMKSDSGRQAKRAPPAKRPVSAMTYRQQPREATRVFSRALAPLRISRPGLHQPWRRHPLQPSQACACASLRGGVAFPEDSCRSCYFRPGFTARLRCGRASLGALQQRCKEAAGRRLRQ